MRMNTIMLNGVGFLCGVIFGVTAMSQAAAQSTATAIVVDDSLGETKTSIIWDFDSQSFAVAVDQQPLLDAVTVIDEVGSPVLLGRWIDGSPTLRVQFGIDAVTGNILIYWQVEGQDPIRLLVDGGVIERKEVCNCSATGPGTSSCATKNCDNNDSCGTGRFCQYRHMNSDTQMIPID